MSFTSKSSTPQHRANSVQPNQPARPDFENNLTEFRLEFFEFVSDTDPNFDLDLLRDNPNPPVEVPAAEPANEVMHPTSKEELDLPLLLRGPKVINGDVFGDEVRFESEVRVKGSVYGRSSVRIGPSCVIEGSLVTTGPLKIEAGSRVEGAAIADEIEVVGSVKIEGPVFSRGSLACRGSLEAQLLYATNSITLAGEAGSDLVSVEAGLIMAKTGGIEVSVPVHLAGVEAKLDHQKFYLGWDASGETTLTRAATVSPDSVQGKATLLTTLTDSDLEKLIIELVNLENS